MILTEPQLQHNTLKNTVKKALKLRKIVNITTQYNNIYVISSQLVEN